MLLSCGYIDYDIITQAEEETDTSPANTIEPSLAPLPDTTANADDSSVSSAAVPNLGTLTMQLSPGVSEIDIVLGGDPLPTDFSIEVRRQIGSAPTTLPEGVMVCSDCPVELTDSGLSSNSVYFYTAFVLDEQGAVVGMVSDSMRPLGQWGVTSSQQTFLNASAADAPDFYGHAVALSGDAQTLVVGAPLEDSSASGINGNDSLNNSISSGAAYVYAYNGSAWIQQAYLKASNANAQDSFGFSVAISEDGSTIAVGAYLEDSSATGINGNQSLNNNLDSGAVYIFRRSGSIWTQEAYLKASNTDSNDNFGSDVSLSGDGNTLAVSARHDRSSATGVNGDDSLNDASNSGACFVFERSAGAWTQQAYLKASNTEAGDLFGQALALSRNGETLAVGASREDSSATGVDGDDSLNGANRSGAVYVFQKNGASWLQQAYLKAPNTDSDDAFGYDVALSGEGNTLAVGAYLEDSGATDLDGNMSLNNSADSGAVYLFRRTNSTWLNQAYVKASNTDSNDTFGSSVSLSDSGRTLAVGAPNERSSATGIGGNQALNDASFAGSVYVFQLAATLWSQTTYVKTDTTAAGDVFGRAVALSGDGSLLIGGATGADLGGATYVFSQ